MAGYRESEKGTNGAAFREGPENPEIPDRFANPENRPYMVDANAMRNGTARLTRGHRTPQAEVGRADVRIQFGRNEQRKGRHNMPDNRRRESPIVSGETAKKEAAIS